MKANVLRIGTTGTETAFLSERDLPDCARLSTTSEEDIITQSRKEAEEKDIQDAIKNSTATGSKCFYWCFCVVCNLMHKMYLQQLLLVRKEVLKPNPLPLLIPVPELIPKAHHLELRQNLEKNGNRNKIFE